MMLLTALEALRQELTDEQFSWLDSALNTLANATDAEYEVLDFSVVVKREFGQQALAIAGFEQFTLDELVRLLLVNATIPSTTLKTLAKTYYQSGDESEKCALLKGLALVDSHGSAVQTAITAGRCNSQNEFRALALNNPYASQHFPELNFNQLVLKALFLGLDIHNIHGLARRLNPALSNMCVAYAVEQALAGRSLPASVWQAIRPDELTPENRPLLHEYLRHYAELAPGHAAAIQHFARQHSINVLTRE